MNNLRRGNRFGIESWVDSRVHWRLDLRQLTTQHRRPCNWKCVRGLGFRVYWVEGVALCALIIINARTTLEGVYVSL